MQIGSTGSTNTAIHPTINASLIPEIKAASNKAVQDTNGFDLVKESMQKASDGKMTLDGKGGLLDIRV